MQSGIEICKARGLTVADAHHMLRRCIIPPAWQMFGLLKCLHLFSNLNTASLKKIAYTNPLNLANSRCINSSSNWVYARRQEVIDNTTKLFSGVTPKFAL